LVNRYDKYINLGGGHVEKKMFFQFRTSCVIGFMLSICNLLTLPHNTIFCILMTKHVALQSWCILAWWLFTRQVAIPTDHYQWGRGTIHPMERNLE
jgi:hypothetical protein